MGYWLWRCGVSALALAFLPLAGLASPAISRADDGCPYGFYYDYYTLNCQPVVQVDFNVDPYIPVPIPNFHPVPVKVPKIPGPPVVRGGPKPGHGGRR